MPRAPRKPREQLTALAGLLLDLRGRAGLRQADAAERLGVNQKYISRIEADQQIPDEATARRLATIYDASDEDRAALLRHVDLMRPGTIDSRLIMQRGANLAFQSRIKAMEESSSLVRAFHPVLIPGALQASGYRAAVFEAHARRPSAPRNADQPAALSASREARWRMLRDEPDRRWVQIVTAGALDTNIGGHEVMVEQMERLTEALALPNLRLGIIPARTPMPVTAHHGWDMYDGRGVCIGTKTATALTTHRADIADYEWLFSELEAVAVWGDDARDLISAAATRYRVELTARRVD